MLVISFVIKRSKGHTAMLSDVAGERRCLYVLSVT